MKSKILLGLVAVIILLLTVVGASALTNYTIGDYSIYIYTANDTFNNSNLGATTAEVFVLAGGGGGGAGQDGSHSGAGGGAGGGYVYTNVSLSAIDYNVVVGLGGATGANGENSVFSTATALGGGFGGGAGSAFTTAGNGGSGGGAGSIAGAGTNPGGSGSQGFDGGDGANSGQTPCGGGGGGAGELGYDAVYNVAAGNGGDGISIDINGTSVIYAGGGGGGTWEAAGGNCDVEGLGGSGGGGDSTHVAGVAGTANLGGGGGAGSSTGGGAGGSGIVILRFLTNTNFTISAINNYGESLNDFNATISGTTYEAVNGSIITTISNSDTTPYNITVRAENHDERNYYNYDVVADLAASLNLSYYKLNITAETFNGTALNNFSATVGGAPFSTTTGAIIANLTKDATYEILVNPPNYTTNLSNLTMSYLWNNLSIVVYPTNTLNLSFYDETTNTLLTENVTYSLIVDDLNATSGNTSTGNTWTENLPAGSYEIRYSATDYDERSYFFTLTDRNYYELSLYLINNTLIEDITNVLRDEYGNLLEGYIIKLLRFYPAESAYLTVDEGLTNFAGETILQAVRNNYYYKFRITDREGTVIKTTGATQIYDTTINHYVTLGAGVGTALERLGDLSYSLAFLNDTNNFRFVFDHASGTVVSASLYLYEITDTGESLINSTTLASGSGTIYTGLTPVNETSYIAKAYVTYSGDTEETYITSLTYTNDDILNIFGQYGVFLTLIICLILVFIGRFNPSVAVILLPVALIITRIAQLHVLAWTHITAITALGFVVIYAIHKLS